MITATYVLLHIALLYILFFYSKRLDKAHNEYWKIALVPIILFSLEEGLRWGRFIDWCAYYELYENVPSTWEFLFRNWWVMFSQWKIPYPIVILICSLLFIFSLFFLFKPYKGVFYIFFPLSVAFSALSAENFIRWYCALSVIFISFRFLLDKRILPFAILACLVPLIHFGTVPLLFLLILMTFIKRTISPTLTICLSVVFILFFNSMFLLRFTNVANLMFGNVEKFSMYISNLEGWITGTGQNSDIVRKNVFIYIISMIPFYFIIWSANKLKNNFGTDYKIIYNLGVVGVLLLSISSGLEILTRYAEIFYPFISLLCAYSIKYIPKNKSISPFLRKTVILVCCIFLIWKFFVFVRPLEREEFMCYIWNYRLSPFTIFNLYK